MKLIQPSSQEVSPEVYGALLSPIPCPSAEPGFSGGSIDVERANIVPAALEVRPAENKPWMKTLNRDWCGTVPWWQLFSLGIKGNIRERPWRVFSFVVLFKGKHLGRVPDLETTRSYRQKLIDFEKPNYFFVFASIDMGRRRKRFLGLSPKLVPK